MLKRNVSVAVTAALALSLAACGSSPASSAASSEAVSSEAVSSEAASSEATAAPAAGITNQATAAIVSAVSVMTGRKGKVVKIEKL